MADRVNLKEAEEVHSYLIDGTRVFGAIALLAPLLVAVSTPWLGFGRHHMNNAKMWLVLPPAVGVPLYLGAVAVLSNTSWLADFLSGEPLGSGDQMASATLLDTDVEAARAAYVLPSYEGGMDVTIIMPDRTPAKAILQPPEINAPLTTAAAPLVVSQ